MGWVIRVDDLASHENRLGREAVDGHRRFPDNRVLTWRQLGVNGLINDPQLPFFVKYDDLDMHPSRAIVEVPQVSITGLTIAGDPSRVREWLDLAPDVTSSVIDFTFVAPHGTAGLLSVTFATPAGPVTI